MDVSNPEDILRDAARAAIAIIPQLESQKASLLAKLHEIEVNISHMKSIIAASSTAQLPETARELPEPVVAPQEAIVNASQSQSTNKAPRGQLLEHIRNVLSPVVPMSAKQIKEALEAAFKITYNRSSIHQSLQKGLKAGEFSCTDNHWILNL